MLNESELKTAVELHQRAYQLLGWVDQAIRNGAIQLNQVHENLTAAEAARQWLWANYANLPTKFRPRESHGPELDWFANLLASYLTV